MRKLIFQQWISLDGYAEDKNGKLDFFPSTEENMRSDMDQLKFLDSVDTILLGRRTYELFVDFWPAATTEQEIIADKLNSIPKLVFSNTLQQAPWGKWEPAQVVNGDAVDQIRELKQQEGKDMVLWGSISLSHALMQANLVDEYHLQICPTATGGGRSAIPRTDGYRKFELVESKRYDTGVMLMRYRPLR